MNGVTLLHAACADGSSCMYCGRAAVWPDEEPCDGPKLLREAWEREQWLARQHGVAIRHVRPETPDDTSPQWIVYADDARGLMGEGATPKDAILDALLNFPETL